MSQLTVFTNVPCSKWNWFLPLSTTTTEQFEGKIPNQGAAVHHSSHKLVTKFSFTCPANFPVLACFYSKWWCMHKICFACNFGNTHEMNKILICKICSIVFMSQCFIHSLEKSMNFLQVHRVLWISETNIKYYTALKKTWEYKKPKEISVFWTQSLSIKTGRYFKAFSVIYKTHPMEIKAIQKY